MVASVGYVKGSIRRDRDAERRIEARQACGSVHGAARSRRARDRGCDAGGSDFANNMVSSIRDEKVTVRRKRNAARKVEHGRRSIFKAGGALVSCECSDDAVG